MPKSRYPRPGFRIGPSSLREILRVHILDPQLIKRTGTIWLYELDETTWLRLSGKACRKLGDLIVQIVRKRLAVLPQEILDRPLPIPDEGTRVDDLGLEVRTLNCLRRLLREEHIKNLWQLGNLTIGRLLDIKGMGAKSLVDLLTALETVACETKISKAVDLKPGQPAPDTQAGRRLTREANLLRKMRFAQSIRLDDPRLAKYFGGLLSFARSANSASLNMHSTLRDVAEQIATRSCDPSDPRPVTAQMSSIRKQIALLSRLALETELKELSTALSGLREATIAMSYLGWDGEGGSTLQGTGEKFGITRERVRQIQSKFVGRFATKRPFVPILDKALRLVGSRLPAGSRTIESALRESRITDHQFRLEGLVSAARLFHRPVPFELEEFRGETIVIPVGTHGLTKRIAHWAGKSISHWGVATIEDVMGQVQETTSFTLSPDIISAVLQMEGGFKWLDKSSGWFWLSSVPRNHLVNQIAKVLSVSPEIHVSELRIGVSRDIRHHGFAPPRRVLLEICKQIPICRVDNETVFANAPLNREEWLSKTESDMLRILTESGPLLERSKFQELCQDAGINPATFTMTLASSPIFARYAPAIYGIRGAQIAPGMIDSLPSKCRVSRRIVDFGWTGDGRVWVVYNLSQGMITSGVIGIPSAMGAFLQGEFVMKGEDASHVGTLVAKAPSAWGLGPFFRRRGGESGDFLLLLFDLGKKEVVVEIGDDALVDEFQEDLETRKRGQDSVSV